MCERERRSFIIVNKESCSYTLTNHHPGIYRTQASYAVFALLRRTHTHSLIVSSRRPHLLWATLLFIMSCYEVWVDDRKVAAEERR